MKVYILQDNITEYIIPFTRILRTYTNLNLYLANLIPMLSFIPSTTKYWKKLK